MRLTDRRALDGSRAEDASLMLLYRPRRWYGRAWQHALMLVATVISVGPLYTMVVTSLHPSSEFAGGAVLPPIYPTLENFAAAWTDLGFARMFHNSFILTVSSSLAATGIAAAAAFGLARYTFKGRGSLLAALILLMAIPPIVVLIPLFVLMADLEWINLYRAGIIAEIGIVLPFTIVLLYSYMKDLPLDQFDAAAVDGAGPLRQFWHVALPLSRPALVTSAVVLAIYIWNDLLVPLILWPGANVQTLMVGLAQVGPGRTGFRQIPLLMAGVTITIVPLVVLFLLSRRMLTRGFAEGGDR